MFSEIVSNLLSATRIVILPCYCHKVVGPQACGASKALHCARALWRSESEKLRMTNNALLNSPVLYGFTVWRFTAEFYHETTCQMSCLKCSANAFPAVQPPQLSSGLVANARPPEQQSPVAEPKLLPSSHLAHGKKIMKNDGL